MEASNAKNQRDHCRGCDGSGDCRNSGWDAKDAPIIRVDGQFYCNVKALSPDERVRHKELTEKLLAARNETIETEKRYEFQYSPDKVSIAEVGE